MSLAIPKQKRVLDPGYLNWVKTLNCFGCNAPADTAHHIKGYKLCGAGRKADDYLTMPMCNGCHTLLHHNPKKWEKNHHKQLACILHTLDDGHTLGKISTNNYDKYTQICLKAWEY